MLTNCLAECAHNYNRFSDRARYWSKIVIFFIPLAFNAPVRGVPVGISASRLVRKKQEWCGYPMVKKFRRYVYSFCHDPRTWRTDRQTPHDSIYRAYAYDDTHRAVKRTGAAFPSDSNPASRRLDSRAPAASAPPLSSFVPRHVTLLATLTSSSSVLCQTCRAFDASIYRALKVAVVFVEVWPRTKVRMGKPCDTFQPIIQSTLTYHISQSTAVILIISYCICNINASAVCHLSCNHLSKPG